MNTLASPTFIFCDVQDHLINQCPELREFNQLYPVTNIAQITRLRYKHHTCHICARNHGVQHYPHLSQFHYLLGFMQWFITKNFDLVRSNTKPSNHSPPFGNEASRSILCVFEEKRQPTKRQAPHRFIPSHHHQYRLGKTRSKSTWQITSSITCALCDNPTIWWMNVMK